MLFLVGAPLSSFMRCLLWSTSRRRECLELSCVVVFGLDRSMIVCHRSDGDLDRLDAEEFTELVVRLGAYYSKL
jgi:hypothetical protein